MLPSFVLEGELVGGHRHRFDRGEVRIGKSVGEGEAGRLVDLPDPRSGCGELGSDGHSQNDTEIPVWHRSHHSDAARWWIYHFLATVHTQCTAPTHSLPGQIRTGRRRLAQFVAPRSTVRTSAAGTGAVSFHTSRRGPVRAEIHSDRAASVHPTDHRIHRRTGARYPHPTQISTPTTTTATSEAPPQISHARVASCRH